ncbi:MAG: hypothetical protein ABIH40_06140 [Candidatus Omnitrophota bacterium]
MIRFISMLISGAGIVIGVFIFLNPSPAIRMQARFYEKINWRIEPISMKREIRNTRIMGLFLIVIGLITIIYGIGKYLCP